MHFSFIKIYLEFCEQCEWSLYQSTSGERTLVFQSISRYIKMKISLPDTPVGALLLYELCRRNNSNSGQKLYDSFHPHQGQSLKKELRQSPTLRLSLAVSKGHLGANIGHIAPSWGLRSKRSLTSTPAKFQRPMDLHCGTGKGCI